MWWREGSCVGVKKGVVLIGKEDFRNGRGE